MIGEFVHKINCLHRGGFCCTSNANGSGSASKADSIKSTVDIASQGEHLLLIFMRVRATITALSNAHRKIIIKFNLIQ